MGKENQVVRLSEAPQTVVTGEIGKDEIRRFTLEQREALEKKGYKVYKLTGRSLGELRKAGRSIFKQGDDKGFESLRSRKSEIAVPSEQAIIELRANYLKGAMADFLVLSLLGSNGHSFLEQQDLIKGFSETISAEVPGVEAIIGGVADYAELFAHGRGIFGEFSLTGFRTNTSFCGDQMWIGRCEKSGLSLEAGDPEEIDDFLYVAPLVVPAESK